MVDFIILKPWLSLSLSTPVVFVVHQIKHQCTLSAILLLSWEKKEKREVRKLKTPEWTTRQKAVTKTLSKLAYGLKFTFATINASKLFRHSFYSASQLNKFFIHANNESRDCYRLYCELSNGGIVPKLVEWNTALKV